MLKLSITGDTANRLVLHSAEVCALFPTRLDHLLCSSSHFMVYDNWKIETWFFRRVSLTPVAPIPPIHIYVHSTTK